MTGVDPDNFENFRNSMTSEKPLSELICNLTNTNKDQPIVFVEDLKETLRQVLDEIESEIKSLKRIRENINPKYRNVITTNENQELRINASIVQLEKNKEIIKKAFGEELVNAL